VINSLIKIDQVLSGTAVDASRTADNGSKGGMEMGKHVREDLVTLGEDESTTKQIDSGQVREGNLVSQLHYVPVQPGPLRVVKDADMVLTTFGMSR
jgi:hypothetical protein